MIKICVFNITTLKMKTVNICKYLFFKLKRVIDFLIDLLNNFVFLTYLSIVSIYKYFNLNIFGIYQLSKFNTKIIISFGTYFNYWIHFCD